ncbi:MAG: hypothetical protein IT359_11710 [Gemmatimonadaceae bacterium]|nr:hypothetical protein [Gemmatimonadaceae bacterium]
MVTLLLLAPALGGCMMLPGRAGRGGAVTGLAEKPVASKEAPTSLIAVDGTRCLVTEEKYRNTAVGDRVWCYWTQDGSQSATSSAAGGAGRRPAGARGSAGGDPARIPRVVGGTRKPGP